MQAPLSCIPSKPPSLNPVFPNHPTRTAVFFAIFFTAYLVAHWRNWLPKVYGSRKYLAPKQTLPHETPPHRRHLFSWLVDSWPVGDKEILRYYGLDVLLFLRSLRLQSMVTFLCALYGLGVILPVNMQGQATFTSPPWGAAYTTAHIGPLDTSTPGMPPINPDDPSPPPAPAPIPPPADGSTPEDATRLFLVHVVGAYYMTGVCLYLLWRQYQEYVELRHAFRQRPQPENYTIMVHHIPGAMRSNTAVSSYFNALFPHSVQKVTIMLELPELEALIAKRDRVKNKLEWVKVVQADRSKLRCAWARSPASIDRLVEELSEELPRLEAQVKEWQEELMDWHVRHERFSRRAPAGGGGSEVDVEGASALEEEDDDEEEEDGGVIDLSASTTTSGGDEETGRSSASLTAQQDPLREALISKKGGGKKKSRRTTRKMLGLGLEEEDYAQGDADEDTNTESEVEASTARRGSGSSSLIPPWILERRRSGGASSSSSAVARHHPPVTKKKLAAGGKKHQHHHGSSSSSSKKRKSAMRALRDKTFRMITGNPVGAIAFVSFRSLAVTNAASHCVTYRHPLKMMSKPAPQPEDIIWTNVYMPMRLLPFKTVLGVGSSVVVTLFFSVIVGIIASLTNVQTLHDHVPFMRDFLENSKVTLPTHPPSFPTHPSHPISLFPSWPKSSFPTSLLSCWSWWTRPFPPFSPSSPGWCFGKSAPSPRPTSASFVAFTTS